MTPDLPGEVPGDIPVDPESAGDSRSARYGSIGEQGVLRALFLYELSASWGGPLAFPAPSSARFRKPSLTVGEVPV